MLSAATASLQGASLRVERAIRHFDEFSSMLRSFREANKDKVIIQTHEDAPENLMVEFDKSLVVPLALSLPVADCIYNLRSALDYLVYELAISDSGKVQEQTQFPIVDCEKNSNAQKYRFRGLHEHHIRAIEALQPYRGTEWTKTLRDISNPDKHRHLIPVQVQRSPYVFAHWSGDLGDFELTLNGENAHFKKGAFIDVGFRDSKLGVFETLSSLITEVGRTIDKFKPEFNLADHQSP
jgi:hypothetical protein